MGSVLVDLDVAKDAVSLQVEDEEPFLAGTGFGEEALQRLQSLREEGSPDAYGWELMQQFFRGDVAAGLRGAVNRAKNSRDSWRIRLHIDPEAAELLPLWWECLYDRDDQEKTRHWFGRRYLTPFSRYVDEQGREAARANKLRVLVVVSNPSDLGDKAGNWERVTRLQEGEELRSIGEALGPFGDRVDHTILTDPASIGMIQERLMEGSGQGDGYHVFHLISHAVLKEGEPTLLLETEEGQLADPVSEDDFAQTVADSTDLRLVVLAGTFTGSGSDGEAFVRLAARAVKDGVPAAIAMRHRVTPTVAQTFAKHFYGVFARSPQLQGMVDAAVSQARVGTYNAVRRRPGEEWDWSIPVLFMRGEGDLFSSTEGDRATRLSSPRASADSSITPMSPPTHLQGDQGGAGEGPGTGDPLQLALQQLMAQLKERGGSLGGDIVLGDKIVGDKTGGDKTGGDKIGGDMIGGDKTGGDKTSGDKTGAAGLGMDRHDSSGSVYFSPEKFGAQAASGGAAREEVKLNQQQGGISIGGGVGGDVVTGDKTGGDKVQGDKVGGNKTTVTFDRGQFVSDLEQVLSALRETGVGDPNIREAVGHLDEARQAAAADAPQEEIKSKFDRATAVLEKTQEVVKTSTKIVELLKKAAKVVGAVIAWL
ncbi:MAG: CHAT domain-containing protein [Actinomycetota bacterium]